MESDAQPGPGPQKPVTIAFLNASDKAVVLKGYSIVKGTPVPGQLLPMKKDGKAFEVNVPANAPRYYSVYDATNPTRVLLRDQLWPVLNRDLILVIKTSPLDSKSVVIVPATP